MLFLLISFVAGIVTVLAPCILPLLPVILGGTVGSNSHRRSITVIVSLIASLFLFTLLIKVSTLFIEVNPAVWTSISGIVLILLSLTMLFPTIWDKIPYIAQLSVSSNKMLGGGFQKNTFIGDIIIGASLGPVFSTCSPVYFVILASILPVSLIKGLVYLLAYLLGLGLVLLAISIYGQKIINKLGIAANPNGTFKKVVGVLFLLVGIAIISGYDKKIQVALASSGIFDVTKVEQKLLQYNEKAQNKNLDMPKNIVDAMNTMSGNTNDIVLTSQGKYHEIVGAAGYVNTGDVPFTIGQYVGKKIIVVDFMTYSCINCQRTFPYLNTWYEKYKDRGLIIIGIHTPEFGFEKVKKNVEKGLSDLGVKFPVVMDNNYSTWNAYANQYWPHKYIIDLNGNIVYDHIGEGNYDETEKVIQQLLMTLPENKNTTTLGTTTGTLTQTGDLSKVQSRETYLGYDRMAYTTTPVKESCQDARCTYTNATAVPKNMFAFSGAWTVLPQKAVGEVGSKITYHFNASKVYLVMGSEKGGTIRVTLDTGEVKEMEIKDEKLYTLVDLGEKYGDHTVTIEIIKGFVEGYAFTFG